MVYEKVYSWFTSGRLKISQEELKDAAIDDTGPSKDEF
jgi:hypothetical protein